MDSKVKFVQTLTSGLETMLTSGQHADVTIVVDGKVFPCHKLILCSLSPYFEAMFTHDMVETRGGIVTLHDVEPEIFDTLLKFMYTGEDHVTADNAEKVFRASSIFQIPCLQERCQEFLLDQVSYDNCVGIWNIARAHNCEQLARKSLEVVLENFLQVSFSPDFQQLDINEILCVIKGDNLAVSSEEFVCDAVMAWVKADVNRRQQHLGRLLEHLRLPLVSADYLFHMLEDRFFDILVDSNQYLTEALKYRACPARRTDFTSTRVKQRQYSRYNDVLVVAGGLLKTTPRFQTTKEVVCYSFQQEKWFGLPSLPNDPGYEFAVCSHGPDVYVSGGWLKLQGMMVYKAEKNKWKTCESMIHGRCGHVMVAVTDAVYVLGGRDGKAPAITNIEEFSLKTKKWRSVGDLLVGIRSMSAAVIGENIFVLGGITETDKDTDTIQCFDIRHQTATIIGDLPFTCRLTRTVTCDDVIYIVFPDGRVVIFDTVSTRKRIASLSDMSVCSESDDREIDSTLPEVHEISMPSPTSPASSDSAQRSPKSSTGSSSSGNVLGRLKSRLPDFNQHHFEAIQHDGHLLLAGGKTMDNTILKQIMVVNPVTCKILPGIEMPSARWCFGCVKTVINKAYLNNFICMEVVEDPTRV